MCFINASVFVMKQNDFYYTYYPFNGRKACISVQNQYSSLNISESDISAVGCTALRGKLYH